MTTTLSTKKLVYKANYGGATPERALKTPRPKRHIESVWKAKQTDG